MLEVPALVHRVSLSPGLVVTVLPALGCGDQVFTSGQLPFQQGKLNLKGKVPADVPLQVAQGAARQAALNGLAAIASVVGSLGESPSCR